MKEVREAFEHEFGVTNMRDFFMCIFAPKVKGALLFQSVFGFAAAVFAFIEKFIWEPGGLFIFLSIQIVIEMIVGATKSIRINKEKFNPKKAMKSVYIWLSHVFILASLHNLSKYYEIVSYLAIGAFIFIFLRNLLSVVQDMVQLGWVKAEVLEFLKKKVNTHNKKLGNDESISNSYGQDPAASEVMD